MTKDEALKIALEALKRATNYDPLIARAITVIKEALANGATNDTSKERVDEIQKQRHEANVQKFLGAPKLEQEPVEIYRNQCADGSRCLHGCHTNEPCYTTPPQRKPLTDEQIDEEFKLYASKFDTSSDKWLDMGADDYFKAGFKAAHGIKE